MSEAVYKAFLSHQSADKEFSTVLGSCLRSNGVDVFLDSWDIVAGDSIPASIEQGLKDCNVFLYVLSPAAVNSKWVQAEYQAYLFRKLNGHELRIIPILRATCESPPLIAPIKYIDFRNFDANKSEQKDVNLGGPLQELLFSIYRTPLKKPGPSVPHPALASYEVYFQSMKNPPPGDGAGEYYELGFKNLTDAPLLNFRFEIEFITPVESVGYDSSRSSANMTGGNGLSEDRRFFDWLGNQLADEDGWAVFVIRSAVFPGIKRIKTKYLGRLGDGTGIILPNTGKRAGEIHWSTTAKSHLS